MNKNIFSSNWYMMGGDGEGAEVPVDSIVSTTADAVPSGTADPSTNPTVSKMSLANIPIGTTLYHASENISQFNDEKINLGTTSLFAFFTTDKNNAMAKIKNCSVEKGFPGYIHVFKVISPVQKILMLDPNDKDLHEIDDKFVDKGTSDNQKLVSSLENKFCKDTTASAGTKLNGIGFVIPKGSCTLCNGNNAPIEYALCNPQGFLKYESTLSCISIGNMAPYNFKGASTASTPDALPNLDSGATGVTPVTPVTPVSTEPSGTIESTESPEPSGETPVTTESTESPEPPA